MKTNLLILSLLTLTISCSKKETKKANTKINIEVFKIDSCSIRAIHAVDENTLFFAGSNGKVGQTTDSGKNWSIKTITYNDTLKPHFRSIAKTNDALFSLSVGNPALLYKIDSLQSVMYKEEHEKVFYDAMHFFENGKDGIAIGDPTETCASIIITSDGGNNWTKIPCSELPPFEDGEAFFAASNTNIKIINNTVWIASGGAKARILKSTDRGKTWNIYETPIVQGNGPQGIYSIDFYDEQNGIIIGGNYSKPNNNCKNKAITTDGGETWTIIADNQNPNYKSCVQYIPNSEGKKIIAVGKTGISMTNDSGATWKQISEEEFYTIQFVNEYTAWLSGNNRIGKLTLK